MVIMLKYGGGLMVWHKASIIRSKGKPSSMISDDVTCEGPFSHRLARLLVNVARIRDWALTRRNGMQYR